ncbi:MAG: hypothetical protein ACRBCI_15610 [Cellvibrionaceae bacterium]
MNIYSVIQNTPTFSKQTKDHLCYSLGQLRVIEERLLLLATFDTAVAPATIELMYIRLALETIEQG